MKNLVCALSIAGALAASAGELTVEVGGLTPHGAVEKIRAAKAAGDCSPWTVTVKPGVHVLDEALVLTAADSGAEKAKVRWVGEKGAVLSGGRSIDGWQDRGDGVWEAPLPKGKDGRDLYFAELWVNGRRADCARLPNEGYFKIAKSSSVSNAAGTAWTETARFTNDEVRVLADVPKEDLPYVQLEVIEKWSFARRIVRGYDAASNVVQTAFDKPQVGWQPWGKRALVCLTNVRTAFDRPGEWFCDMKNGKILYRPLAGEKIATTTIVAPTGKTSRLVRFEGDPDSGKYVTDIEFSGLEIAHSDVTPYGASGRGPTESFQHQAADTTDGTVQLTGARRVRFENCTIRHTGNYGVWFGDGCTSNTLSKCLLEDLGAGGVFMGSRIAYAPNEKAKARTEIKKLAPRSCAFNTIEKCTIRHAGRFNPEGTGIAMTHASDSKAVGNKIYDILYSGISVGWTWGYSSLAVAQRNEILDNRIWNLGQGIMSDLGGIYLLGTSYRSRVAGNVIHDVKCSAYGAWGLYCDEGCEGVVLENNLTYNTTDGGFHQHYGVDNYVRNNIFAFNEKEGAVRTYRRIVEGVQSSVHFYNNIVCVKGSPLIGKGVLCVPGAWANNVYWDASGVVSTNAMFDGYTFRGWLRERPDFNSVCADPLFENPDKYDFRLRPDSPALKLGFKPFITKPCVDEE